MIKLDEIKIIDKAKLFAKKAHGNQIDDDGKSYFESHCVVVADILKRVTDDDEIIAAAYLHDVIEDTEVTYEELLKVFGKRITDLVYEVTHEGTNDSKGYYFPRLKSREAIMLKLADRLSNISRMDNWSESRKAQYLKKTAFWKSE